MVHYTPDPQFKFHRSKLFFGSIAQYDLCVTTKPYELNDYASAGARDTLLVLQGFRAEFHPERKLCDIAANWKSDILFIGHFEPHYARQLRALAPLNVEFSIHGRRWREYARWHRWARGIVGADGVWGTDYAVALASTKIGIGLLSKLTDDSTTTRSFEIPASGALLLAERTKEHMELFEEGLEAEFFDSTHELQEKAARYLRDRRLREQIAAAGRRKCISGGYDSVSQMKRILAYLGLQEQ